ncbi:MAG: hypothetical protein ACR2QM_17890, partial [Longimicrobiales bacterium]
ELPRTIVRQVARSVRATISPTEAERIGVVGTDNPSALDLYMRAKAKDLTRQGRAEGIQLLQAAVAADPEFTGAWGLLAHRLYLSGRWEEGDDALRRAEAEDPEAREVLLAQAFSLYYRESNYVDAVSRLEEIVRSRPNFSDAIFLLGAASRRVGKWDQVIDMYELGLDLDPRNALWTAFLGEAHYLMGNYSESVVAYDRASALDPTLNVAHTGKVRALLWGAGDSTAARLAIEAAPPSNEITSWDAMVSGVRADRARELALWGETVGSEPGGALAHFTWGDTARARELVEPFRQELEDRLSQCPPEDLLAFCWDLSHALLGWVHIVLGNHEVAEGHLLTAVEMRPWTRDALHGPSRQARLAFGYAMMGKWSEATAEFADVLSRPGWHHAPWLRVNPLLAPLRQEDPAFVALLDAVDPR